MQPPERPEIQLPSIEWMLERKLAIKTLLSKWRLLICTAEFPSGLLFLAHLLDNLELDSPQQLIGFCRQSSEVPPLVPHQADDVLLICGEFLQDGHALPMLCQVMDQANPPTVLLVLRTPHLVVIKSALDAGVQGLMGRASIGRGGFLEALNQLSENGKFIDPICQAVLDDNSTAGSELTAREVEVLALVAEGCTNRTIGIRLQIAEVTARDHVQNILSKLQVADRTSAAIAGLRLGYLI